jgi:hypothetical protein
MRRYGHNWLKASVVEKMRAASWEGEYYGKPVSLADRLLLNYCTAVHMASGTCLIFTRDSGHHTSGWFKNPDYERCFHLSLSFREPESGGLLPQNRVLAEEWCDLFFGDKKRWLWIEPPATRDGKHADVYHYRLFCDEHWQPIKPRGEVYSMEFTEKGWRSWSDIHSEEPEAVKGAA